MVHMALQFQRRKVPDVVRSIKAFTYSFRQVSHPVAISPIKSARACTALLLIYCFVSIGASGLYAQPTPAGPQYIQLDYGQLDQLVAPIALYPDALVAQVLAATTYATQIVEAHRFLQRNAGLPPQELAQLVNTQ